MPLWLFGNPGELAPRADWDNSPGAFPLQEHGGGSEGAVHPGRLQDHRGVPHQPAGDRELPEQRHRHRVAGPPHRRESAGEELRMAPLHGSPSVTENPPLQLPGGLVTMDTDLRGLS